MTSFSWQEFFESIPIEFSELFTSGLAPWQVLDGLKDFIRAYITPNLPDEVQIGVPVQQPFVLLPGGWMTEGFDTICNDETKGKLQVWIEGEHVPDATLICAGAVFTDYRVQFGKGVLIEPGAMIKGPTIILDKAQVRQAAYIREDSLIGPKAVVGHATEVKHSVFLKDAKAGHFAYIGDSILGNHVNLGAGTKLANLRFAPGSVKIKGPDGQKIDTNRRKIGAILGDNVQTGCNSVTNPGVFLGKNSMVAPNATVKPGYYPAKTIIR
ncbi:MAG: hypothetical protein GXO58_07220 [Thermodesulfobacteria bacterium]|nr:hypothetical protein [Thermodesulfobacteriota bacterium]